MLLIDSPKCSSTKGRAQLYRSIAAREAELATIVAEAFPEVIVDATLAPARGPRLLSLAELAEIDNQLSDRINRARQRLAQLRDEQHKAELLLERMLRDPQGYRGYRVSLREMGKPGCGAYRVVPRFGIIGRMRGWWCVKLSSGCP